MNETFVSYAQNFEDVMLWRALKHVPDGFYIDVGAYSPDYDSVTKAFYDRGWRGINVEPNIDLIGAFRVARPRDINLNVALGDHDGDVDLNVVSNPGLSTVDPHEAALRATDGYAVHTQHTRLRTLASVWEEHVPVGQEVHFLKVDVEGLEREVVRGNDWNRFRPWITLIEATHPMTSDASYGDWEPWLLDAHYQFAYADGLNRFYVAAEHMELLEPLALPPNWFDHFMLRSEFVALNEAAVAAGKATEAQARVVVLEHQIRLLEGSLSWRLTGPLRRASAAARGASGRLAALAGALRRR